MAKQINLEKSFEELDEIINKLENNQISLEESFNLYKKGVELVKGCNGQLEKIEKQIILLNEDGENNGVL